MKIPTFDAARRAVAQGAAIADVARALVAELTPDEKLWCLDGDALSRFTIDRFDGVEWEAHVDEIR